MENVIEMKNITKLFPGIIANDNVNFQLRKGEIHVLLGENGAGKTTLMNVLYGLYQQEIGDIFVKGKKVNIHSPKEAIALGIGMVHQHFMLVNNFTVAENIVLGMEPKKGLVTDVKKAISDTNALSEKYGFNIKAEKLIEDMTVGEQQKVEILKALYRGAEILILDEPTAVLTPLEIKDLENILHNMIKEGKSIILITHKLKEVKSMSDRVTIIRRGKVIDVINTHEADVDKLAELMVGRKVKLSVDKKTPKPGKAVLKVDALRVMDNRKLPAVKEVSFEVREGEILAIAGVDGNGQWELIEAITGLRAVDEGRVLLGDKEITGKKPREIIEEGLGHIPEDRHKRGLILKYSLVENSVLGYHYKPPFAKGIIINQDKVRQWCRDLIEGYDIRTPNEDVMASSLSGGNQQKLIIAREVEKEPVLIIAAQPTRGLDVGAIEYIHKRLVEERDKGRGVLLISLELDEVLSLADRIAVIYDGRIQGELSASEATEQKLGILMAGGNLDFTSEEEKK
ncbi:ABC transporter ATP-binding protein [Alloiococcus sp. CFN-8]|uniref:ABC transporter ATP-binding protein n=1 Tax=Alloiococcus sp. CFN-8 TaxID=3416081 RepID=UPI003CFACD26